jgi:hypothetical protein
MGLKRGPKIVTDGLILYLDAAITTSYPRSGTTWFDLSGNNNNFTLTNGPTFSSTNSGNIIFDGTNDYASSTSTLNLSNFTSVTVEVWFKPSVSTGGMVFEHSANWNTTTGGFGLYPNSTGFVDDSTICHTNSNPNNMCGPRNYAFTCGTTLYSCHVNVFSTSTDSAGRLTYVNGNLLPFSSIGGFSTSTATTNQSVTFRNDTMYLASRAGTGAYYNGSIAMFKIYNRKLSASEILQNFNAIKPRFNL